MAAGTAASTRRLPSTRTRLASGISAVIIVVVGVVVGFGGGGPRSAPAHAGLPRLSPDVCPLTDTRPVAGAVPRRPALGVTLDGGPGAARSESGLGEADVVLDTPVSITSSEQIAVFQCEDASRIGPLAPVRLIDKNLMRPFIHPILAFAGGSEADVAAVDSSTWLLAADLAPSNPVPSDGSPTSTAALYGRSPRDFVAPPPVFEYTPDLPPGATAAATLRIDFPPGRSVEWRWDRPAGVFVRSEGASAVLDALTGRPVTAANVVVEVVDYKFAPGPRSGGANTEVEGETTGNGRGYVLREGMAMPVSWHRPNLVSPTTFTSPSGAAVGLSPGRTWVEIVLNTTASHRDALTISP